MRDSARIAPFTSKFMELWLQHPDLRFFQLVSMIECELKERGWRDGFYAEEPVILGVMQKMLDE